VHTTSAVAVRVGQDVRVNGLAQSEFMGMGHEIINASVSPLFDSTSGTTTTPNTGMGGPYEPIDNISAPDTSGARTTPTN